MIQSEFLNVLKIMGIHMGIFIILEILFVITRQEKKEDRDHTKVNLPDPKTTRRTFEAIVNFWDIFEEPLTHRRHRRKYNDYTVLVFEKSQTTGKLRPQLWRHVCCIIATALFFGLFYSVLFASAGCNDGQAVIAFFILFLFLLLAFGIPYTVVWIRGYKAIQREIWHRERELQHIKERLKKKKIADH